MLYSALALSLLLQVAPAPAQSPTPAKAAKADAPADKEKDKEKEKDKDKKEAEEKPVTTQHELRLAGRVLKYSVTTGLMPLKNEQGEVEAQVFFMAYVADRPGGPEIGRAHV